MNDWHLLTADTPKDRTLLGCDMAEYYLPFVMILDDAFGWCGAHMDALYSPTHWMEQPAPPHS